jgi:hypothetical protein
MAKTNFDAPVTVGNIQQTTQPKLNTSARIGMRGNSIGVGGKLGQRNIGFVEAVQTYNFNHLQFARAQTSICTAAGSPAGDTAFDLSTGTGWNADHVNPDGTTGAAAFIPGTQYGGGIYPSGSLTFTSTTDNSALTVTVIGEGISGEPLTLTGFTLPALNSSVNTRTVQKFAWVSSIVASGNLASGCDVGFDPQSGGLTTVWMPCRSLWNETPMDEDTNTVDKNLANNILIPASSRITELTATIPDNHGLNYGTTALIGFSSTNKRNSSGVRTFDANYFTEYDTADATVNTGVVYNSLTNMGNLSSTQVTQHLDISEGDSTPYESDKDIFVAFDVNGTAPSKGKILICCRYLQAVNVTN